jgi:hypothetical protein
MSWQRHEITLDDLMEENYKIDNVEDRSRSEIIICECNNTQHQMVFHYDEADNYPTVYAHVHLNKLPFFKRLVYGIKYIFGYQSRYGAFDEFIVDNRDIKKFKEIVKYLNKAKLEKKLL